MDQIKGAEHEFDVFKKILLQVCLIYTNKVCQKDCHMYSFGKCIIATIQDQSFFLHGLLVKYASAKGIIWKMSECIEKRILYRFYTFEQFSHLLNDLSKFNL